MKKSSKSFVLLVAFIFLLSNMLALPVYAEEDLDEPEMERVERCLEELNEEYYESGIVITLQKDLWDDSFTKQFSCLSDRFQRLWFLLRFHQSEYAGSIFPMLHQ